MGLFDNFPYMNLHEINLDWILSKLGLLDQSAEAAAQSAEAAAQSATEAKASESAAAGSATSADEAAQRAENTASSIAVNGRRFVLIGDSYLRGVIPGGLVKGWGYWFKQYAGLADNACYIFGESRAGMCAVGAEGHKFADLLTAKASEVSSPDGITDVYYIGGYNDAGYSTETVQAACTNAISVAKQYFPNAVVKLGFVGRNTSTDNQLAKQLYQAGLGYRNTYSDAAYLSGIDYACRDINYFSSDGIHPTETGYQVIGRALFDITFTGSPRSTAILRTYSGFPMSSCTLCGETLAIHFDTKKNYSITALNGKALNGSTRYQLGLVTTGALCTGVTDLEFGIQGWAKISDNTWIPATLSFGVDTARQLTVRVLAVKSDGSTATAANTSSFSFNETIVQVPAILF